MSELQALFTDFGVQADDLEKARLYQQKYGGRIEQILVNMGSLSSDTLPDIYARLLGVETLRPPPHRPGSRHLASTSCRSTS